MAIKAKSTTAATEKKDTTRRKKSEAPTNGHSEVLAPTTAVVEEQIRVRAYEIYLRRGRQDGSHESDWFTAEAELRTQTA